jgi:hypothetical protein
MKRRPAPMSAEQIVRDYLGRVSTEAQRLLPKGDRLLFVGRTRAAIEARVGPLASADIEDVLTALTALGDPQELVKQERERLYTARRRGAAAQPPALWKPSKAGKQGTQPLPERSGGRRSGRQPKKPRPWGRAAVQPGAPEPAAGAGQPATSGAEPAPGPTEPASTPAQPAAGTAGPGTRAAPPRWPGTSEPMVPEPRRAWPRSVPSESAAPGAAAPGSAAPEAAPSEPQSSAPAPSGPGLAQPVLPEPVPFEPVPFEPQPAQPQPAQPQPAQPGAAQPQPAQPGAAEPEPAGPGGPEPVPPRPAEAAGSDPTRPLSIVPGMSPPGEEAPPLPGERLPGDRRARPRTLAAAPLGEAWALARKHPLEAVTVVLLGVGGLLYPFPLWLIAALVGTRSRRWDKRDKWAVLAGPPLFTLAGLVLLAATRQGSFFSVFFHAAGHDTSLLIRVGCVLWAGYLVWRLRRGPRSRPAPPWQRAR